MGILANSTWRRSSVAATQRSREITCATNRQAKAKAILLSGAEGEITTTHGCDENNNRLSLTDPKVATRSWTYDERNFILPKVMPDHDDTCLYTHDALARLKVKAQHDTPLSPCSTTQHAA